MEESKEPVVASSVSLLDTIKVPRNLGLITERLPKANYNSNPTLKRNSSVPSRIGQLTKDRDSLLSARPSQLADNGLRGLAPIREELRSAERGCAGGRQDSSLLERRGPQPPP